MTSLKRIVRVVLAGGAATALDTLVLVALYYVGGVAAGTAAVFGCLAGGALNFTLNRRWVFDATRDAFWKQAVLYAIVIVGGGAVISGIVVGVLHVLGIPLVVAKLAAIGFVLVAWTYPMSAYVVFRARDAGLSQRGAGSRLQSSCEVVDNDGTRHGTTDAVLGANDDKRRRTVADHPRVQRRATDRADAFARHQIPRREMHAVRSDCRRRRLA